MNSAASLLSTQDLSLRLAAHLIVEPQDVARKDMVILELGSGSGFLGSVVAKLAPTAHIHLTDRDGIVLDHLQRTINCSKSNRISTEGHNSYDIPLPDIADSERITVAPLDWLEVEEGGTDTSSLYLASLRPHLILAADVIYDPNNTDAICRMLKLALSWSKEAHALVAYPIRNNQTHQLFLQSVSEYQTCHLAPPYKIVSADFLRHLDQYGLTLIRQPLHSPDVDLLTGKLIPSGNGDSPSSIFPTIHDKTRDGPMMLYRLGLKR